MNKVMLVGNAGKGLEVRYFGADQAVAQLTLVTIERGYTLQNGTRVPDHIDWHNIVFYHGLAKVVEKYVHKGDRLYVEGRLRYRTCDDQYGIKRYVTEVPADSMELLSPKRGASSGAEDKTGKSGPSEITAPTNDTTKLPF